MGLFDRFRRGHCETPPPVPRPRSVDIRIAGALFDELLRHVEDFSRGEEGGFLLCGLNRGPDRDVLLARVWRPIPESELERGRDGSVLSWSAKFNSEILQLAIELDCSPILVHSHGGWPAMFSPDDRAKERQLFGAVSRLVEPYPAGSLLLGGGATAGSFWLNGRNDLAFRRLVVIRDTLEIWHLVENSVQERTLRRQLDRQSVAIGPASDAKLAEATVAVIGISGGGSHVIQQLAHQGVGNLIGIDDQMVDNTNLGRLVGATRADVDRTPKVELARRQIGGIDPEINFIGVDERFPSRATIAALRDADVVVACLDRFDARANVNAFCRRHLIPLVDIGVAIRSSGERLASADGQISVSLPGSPCQRCWFLTDAVLEAERRDRPPSYDDNPDAPGDPQVVSMNGVLASEACNCVLDLLTAYSGGRRGARMWQYEGRGGELTAHELPDRRPGCPACAEEGHGDPRRSLLDRPR
jgi:molybdopterin/thiamine biosynthesis adenylyltransferase